MEKYFVFVDRKGIETLLDAISQYVWCGRKKWIDVKNYTFLELNAEKYHFDIKEIELFMNLSIGLKISNERNVWENTCDVSLSHDLISFDTFIGGFVVYMCGCLQGHN